MIDEEVETVLREIRERVTSQPLAERPASGSSTDTNGNQNSQLVGTSETRISEALARLNAHLTTTARAWDRLPPVFSNRSGTAARIEVWIKARLKVFSRWFIWEQVNFNAAVHHALSETLTALTEQDAKIQNQREEIETLRAQLRADAVEIRGELEGVRIQSEDQKAELQAKIETSRTEAAAEVAKISEHADRIENEHRVCFKQLSLETNEMVVSNDRAQQRVRTLLEEMNQRIKQLEDSEKRKPRS